MSYRELSNKGNWCWILPTGKGAPGTAAQKDIFACDMSGKMGALWKLEPENEAT